MAQLGMNNDFDLSKEIPFVGEESYMEKVMNDFYSNIRKSKEKIFFNKLSDLGIDINLENESKRRFKRFIIESHIDTGHETWFYNDGSLEGLRVVTFINPEFKLSFDQKDMINYGSEINYF